MERPPITGDMMNLRSLVEKSADADFLREMTGLAAETLMALEPEVLVAGEAVSALDVTGPGAGSQTARGPEGTARSGHAVHYPRSPCRSPDLRPAGGDAAGKIVETGPAAALFANPRHEYTRQLLAAIPGSGSAMEDSGQG